MGGPRVRMGWAAVLVLIAALGFAASYHGGGAALALVMAAVGPFVLVRGLQAARLGVFVPALMSIAVATGGAWLALRRADSPGTLGGLGDALPRLLTTPRPAPATAALLAPPLLLVALVSTLVAASVCAGRHSASSGRTPQPAASADERGHGRVAGLLTPVLGAVVLYVAAALLAAGTADPYGVAAASLLTVAALGWSADTGRLSGVSGSLSSVAAVLGVVGLAVATLALPRPAAFDARRHVTPPAIRLEQPSPLTQLAAWSVNPSVAIMRVRAQGVSRLHLATLTRFTGDSWQVADRYRQLGLDPVPDLPPGTRQRPTSATVQVVRLGGVWLPAAGRTRAASLPDVLVDADTGTLARTEPARPGLTYTLRGTADVPTGAQLTAAAVPASPPAGYLALPDAPSGLAQYAREAVRGASTPLEEAIALEATVTSGRRLNPKAPSGSSYARLQTFLFSPRGTAGAREGSDEQFAAAFAVLAREVGLPSRLTVGFLLDGQDASRAVTLHGRDATVWPEVYFSGVGWVPFSPTPGAGSGDGGGDRAGLRQTVLKRLAARADQPPPVRTGNASAGAGAAPPSRPPAQPVAIAADRTALWLLLGAAVLLLAIAALLGARLRRTRRHRRAGARGAWAEFEDLLVLIGHRPDQAATAPDLALAFDVAHPGAGPGAMCLAHLADRAAYAPHAAAADASGPQAWREMPALRRRAVVLLPRYRRWLLPFDPRPLRR